MALLPPPSELAILHLQHLRRSCGVWTGHASSAHLRIVVATMTKCLHTRLLYCILEQINQHTFRNAEECSLIIDGRCTDSDGARSKCRGL